jgi:hypothetical protein
MGDRLKVPFKGSLTIGGGGVMTFVGTAEDQAVYWSLEALDPRPGEGPWSPVGKLQRPRYRVGVVRFGTGFLFGTKIPFGGIVRWHPANQVDSSLTITDASRHAVNIYLAPKTPPLIRFGMHYKFGEVVFGQESGLYDRVTAKAVLD